jgi:hypothetical protein
VAAFFGWPRPAPSCCCPAQFTREPASGRHIATSLGGAGPVGGGRTNPGGWLGRLPRDEAPLWAPAPTPNVSGGPTAISGIALTALRGPGPRAAGAGAPGARPTRGGSSSPATWRPQAARRGPRRPAPPNATAARLTTGRASRLTRHAPHPRAPRARQPRPTLDCPRPGAGSRAHRARFALWAPGRAHAAHAPTLPPTPNPSMQPSHCYSSSSPSSSPSPRARRHHSRLTKPNLSHPSAGARAP